MSDMAVHISAGSIEIAVSSSGSLVYSQSVRAGSDKMDEAIVAHMKRARGLTIDEQTAGRIRMTIGSACALDPRLSMEVSGWSLAAGAPSAAVVSSDEIREALDESVNAIVEGVHIALVRTPPELAAGIADKGIALTGGSVLRNLDVVVQERTGLAVTRTAR